MNSVHMNSVHLLSPAHAPSHTPMLCSRWHTPLLTYSHAPTPRPLVQVEEQRGWVELAWPTSCTAPLPPDPVTPQAGVWGAHTVCELRVPIRQGAAAPGDTKASQDGDRLESGITGISQNRECWVHHWVSRFASSLLSCLPLSMYAHVHKLDASLYARHLWALVCVSGQFVCFSTCVCLWALVTHAQHCGKAVGNLPHSKTSRTSNPDLRF